MKNLISCITCKYDENENMSCSGCIEENTFKLFEPNQKEIERFGKINKLIEEAKQLLKG